MVILHDGKRVSPIVVDTLFKVVRITDHDGNTKECYPTHSRIFNKTVRVANLYEEATALIVPVDTEGKKHTDRAVVTSAIETVSYTKVEGLPARLVIYTLNTVYYLDGLKERRT